MHIKLDKYPHLVISIVFWFAVFLSLRNKYKQIKLENNIYLRLSGGLIFTIAIAISLLKPGSIILGFFPFIAFLGLVLLIWDINGIKKYRQELIIFALLGTPKIILPWLPDISLLTAKFCTFLLWSLGFSVTLKGQYLYLLNGGVKVVPACSGLNLIIYMLGISIIFLFFFDTQTTNNKQKITLLPCYLTTRRQLEYKFSIKKLCHTNLIKLIFPIASIIIGFTVNGIRISLLAVLSTKSDMQAFKYWHSENGALIFVIIAVFLFCCFYKIVKIKYV